MSNYAPKQGVPGGVNFLPVGNSALLALSTDSYDQLNYIGDTPETDGSSKYSTNLGLGETKMGMGDVE